MGALAIILGRAGSKGLPGKNLAMVAGRRCIEWTIDDALAARSVSRIAVSTDSTEMQTIALQRGIDAIARPVSLATDDATVDDAARHAVISLDEGDAEPRRQGHTSGSPAARSDPIVILYANVPSRPAGLIDRAVSMLRESRADSVQSYAPVGKHHPWWTARLDEGTGTLRPWEGPVLNHGVFRRQDLPPAFVPDGGVLVVTRRSLFLEVPGVAAGPHAFLGAQRRGTVTREGEVVDIDSRIDLLVADAVLRERGTLS